MTLTATERSAINRQNASHSTGPKSEAGKNRAKLNAVTHGLTSRQLTLPGEDPDAIQAQLDAWILACKPKSLDEAALVEQAALGMIRLQRCAVAETAIVADQVRHAELAWDHTRSVRVLELSRALNQDPARAVLDLKTFSAGVNYLLDRWRTIQRIFQRCRRLENDALLGEMIRLMGQNPAEPTPFPADIYEFVLAVLSCGSAATDPNDPKISEFMKEFMPPEVAADYGARRIDQTSARRLVDATLASRITELERLEAELKAIDDASRAGAKDRARKLSDSAENRLFLRYMKSSETGFDRAVKTLTKLQTQRAKADAEAEEADVRTEPNPPVAATSSEHEKTTYVEETLRDWPPSPPDRTSDPVAVLPISAVPSQTLRIARNGVLSRLNE